jgi:hypothetical protein
MNYWISELRTFIIYANYKATQENLPVVIMKISRLLFCLPLACISLWSQAGTTALDAALEDTVKTIDESRQSQQTIDKLADETTDMLQEYRTTVQQLDSLESYNQQLEKLITTQDETLASIAKQLDSVEETQRNIVPLMLNMIDVLEKFIALDMPFLLEERQARLQIIREMMDRPDVTLPDKYRRIMESYQIEMDYGRTINTSSDTIELDNKKYTVDTLRIGRVALLYQTLDGARSGYWDKQEKIWKALPDEYNQSVARGILIARKQSPPDLFKIPVQAPERAK